MLKENRDGVSFPLILKLSFTCTNRQSKIENFIQSGLRNPILVGHRQAWSWQDEWHGLTIQDIRALEKQTQLELSERMKVETAGDDSTSDKNGDEIPHTPSPNTNHKEIEGGVTNSDNSNNFRDSEQNAQPECSSVTSTVSPSLSNHNATSDVTDEMTSSYKSRHRNSSIKTITNQERLLEIHMKHIEQLESDEADEDEADEDEADEDDDLSLYYDALGKT